MGTTSKAAVWKPVRELVDRVAPYPKEGNGTPVTAAAITRHALVQAQVAFVRNNEMPVGKPGSAESAAWIEACLRFIDRWTVAALFRALTLVADEGLADETAGNIWADLEAGDSPSEWLWEWLKDAGVDPAELTAAVQAACAAEREAAKYATP